MASKTTLRMVNYPKLMVRVSAQWGNASSPIKAETSENGGKTWEPAYHPWQVADFRHDDKAAAKAIGNRVFAG